MKEPRDGKGYALGFDAPELDSYSLLGMRLLPVEYKTDTQIQVLDRLVERPLWRAQGVRSRRQWETLVFPFASTVMPDLADYLCSVKGPSFACEEEWRCVVRTNDKGDALWDKMTTVGGREFVRLELFDAGPPLLKEIIIGPSNGRNRKELDSLLRMSRLRGVEVRESRLPFVS